MRVFSLKTVVSVLLCVALVLLLWKFDMTYLQLAEERTEMKTWVERNQTPNTEDSLILPKSGVVNVIEEHHEALMYWFSAAAKGTIKKQGNTLLHIDAHSEAANPQNWRKLPLFQLPQNRMELHQMMEKSNAFVHMTAATGLINRFIWVWPAYDSGMYEPYVSVRLRAGVMYRHINGGRDELVLCACAESVQLKIHNMCVWIDTHRDDRGEYFEIQEVACLDMSLSGTVEFVSTVNAMELANSGTWISAGDSVILDIDEDYYAREDASTQLYDVGMSDNQIYDISSCVAKLMCVDNAHDELMADKFFRDLLMITLGHTTSCNDDASEVNIKCPSHLAMKSSIIGNLNDILEKAKPFLCMPKESTQVLLDHLIGHLVYLSERQLEELSAVGVCMNQSPRSPSFIRNIGMVVCTGNKMGTHNSRIQEIPNFDEEKIDQTTKQLQTILSQPFSPGVVTLVRSARDGFTPRKHVHTIEAKVINVLKTVFPNRLGNSTIHYDSELLGGKNGWYFRHKRT
ncbi:uncharacterized protein [Haliotis asinina]|uniref:uncharacterized protein n=1 Tax=Haliotis asinina TaxID=109174 RepID=UPI0035325F38